MSFKTKTKLYEWQLKAKQGGRCENCGQNTNYLTVDHIVPVSIIELLDETGLMVYEFEDNFQLLCQPCNKFKANRLDKRNSKTKEILLALLK